MKYSILQEKSFEFALDITDFYKYLRYEKKEYVFANQILKSGTSIGANVEESLGASSTKDFIAKLSISYREARETFYWLKILNQSDIINDARIPELMIKCEELIKIITSILKKSKGI